MPSSKDIRAGRGFVEIDGDLSPLDKALKQIGTRFKRLGAGISGIGKRLVAVGAGTTAIGTSILAPLTAAVKKFQEYGDTLDKTAARTGVSVEALQELEFAAQQGGAGLAEVEKGLFGLSRSLFDASRGSGEAVDALQALNLTYQELAGLSPEEQFEKIAANLAAITDESKRGAVAQKLFGRSGRQLLPMLSTLRETRQEARDLGLVLSKTDTDNAAKLTDSMNRVARTIGGAFLRVGAAIAEPVTRALDAITKITAQVNHWVNANRALVQQIAAIGLGVAAAGVVVTGLGVAFIGLGATIASIGAIASAAFGAVSAALAVVTSPITLAVVGIAAIGAAVLHTTGSLQVLADMFGQLGDTATTAWAGIVAAISTGDLQTAGQIAFTALEVAWLTLTTKIEEVWTRVSNFFVNAWLEAVESIVLAGARIATGLVDGFDTALGFVRGAIDAIQTAIAKAIITAQRFFGLFSASEAEQIKAALDSDLAKRGQQRERELGQRFGERAATAKQFADTVAEDFQRRRATSTADRSGLNAAQERLEKLQAELSIKASAAQERAATAQLSSESAQRASSAQLAAAGATSAGSVGTFAAGLAASILGGGSSPLEDLGQQQVDLLGSIDERLRASADEGTLT